MGSICSLQVSQWCLSIGGRTSVANHSMLLGIRQGEKPEGGRKGRGEDPLGGTFKTVQKI